MSANPLHTPGQVFDLELANPNPTSSKTKDGPVYRVSFEVPRDVWDCFMDAKTAGMLLAAKACVVDEGGEAEALERPQKGPYSAQAALLWRSPFFRTPEVWQAIGSDAEYQAWLRTRPCCASGPHQGDVVVAHVRRVENGAGTGLKPEYSAIPLCAHHHAEQHQHGESFIGGKEWADHQRIRHVQRWGWDRLVELKGATSMTDVLPATIRSWAERNRVERFLPRDYV